MQRLPSDCKEVVLEKGVTLKELLQPHLGQKERTLIVSAGGDGSVHYLVNHLLKDGKEYASNVTLGAIGLGSSNDFLKPFGEKIKGIPVRINYSKGTLLHDTGMVTYMDDANLEQRKFFIVNASVGVTAKANWNFNNPDYFLRFLKKQKTSSTIVYADNTNVRKHSN